MDSLTAFGRVVLAAVALALGKATFRVAGSTAALRYYSFCRNRWPEKELLFLSEMSFICERAGRTTQAIEYCTRALELDPQDGMLHFDLGCLYEASGELGLALSSYETALARGAEFGDEFRDRLVQRISTLKHRIPTATAGENGEGQR